MGAVRSAALAAIVIGLVANPAWAQVGHGADDGHGHAVAADGHGADDGHGHAAADGHADAHGAHHGPGEINWFEGFVGESADAEPGLLWRAPGTQPPLGAALLNVAILFWLLVRFGKQPVIDGLKKRRGDIMKGMDEAAAMKESASERLEEYEAKLRGIEKEIKRVRKAMKRDAEHERERILEEAQQRRVRMERDARLLVQQELKAAREQLLQETAKSAVRSAAEMLAKQVASSDQQRLADEYLKSLEDVKLNSLGGNA